MPALERTFAIIKPDAVAAKATGAILQRIEQSGLEIVAIKRIQLTEQLARGFYAVHKARPFYGDLVKFMTSGPVVLLVLQGDGAIRRWVDVIWTSSRTLRAWDPKHIRVVYFGVLLGYVALGLFFLSIGKPLGLLTTATTIMNRKRFQVERLRRFSSNEASS